MTNRNLADKEIIEQVKKGNYRALDGFYLENKITYSKWVYNHYKITDAEVEDLYHDAFEALVMKIIMGKLDDLRYTLRSYFFGISKHLIFQKFRLQKVYAIKDYALAGDDFETIHPDVEEEKLKIVIDCKKNLSAACQSILDLFYAENKSMKEIAVMLNYKNDDVVKAQKSRCVTELRLCVKTRLTF